MQHSTILKYNQKWNLQSKVKVQAYGTTSRTLNGKHNKETLIKCYKIMAIPVGTNESETCNITKKINNIFRVQKWGP